MTLVKILGPSMVALGLAAAPIPPASAHHPLEEMEEALRERDRYLELTEREAPVFASLRDADGRSFSLEDFRGKVVVLNFLFATCTDVCPLHSDLIASLQEQINALPIGDEVRFITITTHPELDTPEILRSYGARHGLDPASWMFLTSGPERPAETRGLAQRYGLKFTPVSHNQFVHGVVTHLIDQEGMLRARYHGLRFDQTNFVDHVHVLLDHELDVRDGQSVWGAIRSILGW
jgi:protein SCO1